MEDCRIGVSRATSVVYIPRFLYTILDNRDTSSFPLGGITRRQEVETNVNFKRG